MKRIMILASERSGTNLLRTLLGNHNDISAPVAPHFFDAFKETIHLYGDLNINKLAVLFFLYPACSSKSLNNGQSSVLLIAKIWHAYQTQVQRHVFEFEFGFNA